MNARESGTAVEYLRKSVERDKAEDRDKGAAQRHANRAAAAADGVEITRTFDADWGTGGGRDKRGKRHAMASMIEAVRVGEVSRVYCHTADRLARDVEYGMTFWNACKDAGTLIRAGSQTFDPREPGWLPLWASLIAGAEEELDKMARKNSDVSSWRAQHIATCDLPGRPHQYRCYMIGCTDRSHCGYSHRIGHPYYGERPGEDPAAVIAAFQEAGSVLGAAKLLNRPSATVPTRMGGPWSSVSVREILVRLGAMPHRTRPGAKARAPFVLYGLLRCHCGHVLTGSRFRNGSDAEYTTYKCHLARSVPDHGLGSVPEKRILPWVKAQAALHRPPAAVEVETAVLASRDRLTARRIVIDDMYEANGPTWAAEYRRRLAAIREEEAALDATEADLAIADVPEIDWDQWTPAEINRVLGALWRSVRLDATMSPVEPDWRRQPAA